MACLGGACLPFAAIPAGAVATVAAGAELPINFDPFETTATEAVATGNRHPNQAANYDPFVTTAPGAGSVIPLHAERVNDYDPFDAPGAGGMLSRPGRVRMLQAAENMPTPPTMPEARCQIEGMSPSDGEFSPCEFQEQESGPALAETIPAPLPAPQDSQANESVNCQWTTKPLGELTTNIGLPSGPLPQDCSAERPPLELPYWDPCGATRGWPLVGYQWKASAFCHQPLYFEEINLERYGYGCCGCLQYGVSAAHFFCTVPALPYLMAVDCPCECDYTLGHYRPGSCPPWRFHWPRCCDPLAAASEGGVLTGLIFLIP